MPQPPQPSTTSASPASSGSAAPGAPAASLPPPPPPTLWEKAYRWVVGAPRNLADRSLFHHMSLVPFLAWVGLGADGLSSSSYGPEEAFLALGKHTSLAVGLAALSAFTVLLIASAYSHVIEKFPHGGGAYVVVSSLLGRRFGALSGCALLIDYVLTITVSIAAAWDALFSMLSPELHEFKLVLAFASILVLMGLNIRGIKETVGSLAPVFVLFLITHILLIGVGLLSKIPEYGSTARHISQNFSLSLGELGPWPLLMLFLHAYSLGGGTYTGIEAVSNGVSMMREPRVQTAKRTMLYMAASLAITAAGLTFCYLLWDVSPQTGKTLNATLLDRIFGDQGWGRGFTTLTLFAEGALLIVAAQAGFLDGPRVLATMAVDSWVPHRFAALSDRLTTHNGVMLMGIMSLIALFLTGGDVRYLVVMYSINVFVAFSLSMLSMTRYFWKNRATEKLWKRRLVHFSICFVFCFLILLTTIVEKFSEGGWVTIAATLTVLALCFIIRRHYRLVGDRLRDFYAELSHIPLPEVTGESRVFDPQAPTAAILVSHFGGLGIHTLMNIFRIFPNYFKNIAFVSVGVIGSGEFKGEQTLLALQDRTRQNINRYIQLAQRIGIPAKGYWHIGTDPVSTAEQLCVRVAGELGHVVFFAGKVVFDKEQWVHHILHNETAFAIEKRLQNHGLTMAILPARIFA